MANDQVAAPSKAGGPSKVSLWIVALACVVLSVLGAIDLAAELKFTVAGERRQATVLATEGGIGRQRSETARASVRLPDAPAMPIEIHDTLGNQHWKEGDNVDVLCARIHADHVTCIADLWFDRYAVDTIMLGVGALGVAGAWKLRRP